MKLLDKLLSDWITPFLRQEGFRKLGKSYEREGLEAILVIGYQRSLEGGDCDKFTVNLGIASKRLFAFEDQRNTRRTPVELCHWRTRLGRVLEEPANTWWELCGSDDLATVGRQHLEILKTRALPLMGDMASDEALRTAWREGRGAGLTELQRLVNLTVLLNDPEHREEQRAVIGHLKELASRKGFGGRVAVVLEELGVE